MFSDSTREENSPLRIISLKDFNFEQLVKDLTTKDFSQKTHIESRGIYRK